MTAIVMKAPNVLFLLFQACVLEQSPGLYCGEQKYSGVGRTESEFIRKPA